MLSSVDSKNIIKINLSGLPAAVGNLNAKQNDSCTIIVEWDPPFTFIGLSVYYLITISIGEDVIISSEGVYTNNYTFYPTNSSSGLYVIEVTSINDVGTGEKTTTNFNFEGSKFSSYYLPQ